MSCRKSKLLSLLIIFLSLSLAFSCKTATMNLAVPKEISESANKIKIKGTKGSGFVGTTKKLKFDSEFSGTRKNGWTTDMSVYERTSGGIFSEEATRRSLLNNVGININNISSTRTEKFQVTVDNQQESINAFCKQQYLGKSISTEVKGILDYSKGLSQTSIFNLVLKYDGAAKKEWEFNLAYHRETPNGIIATTLNEGMPTEKGFLTNGIDTVHVQPAFIDRNVDKISQNSLFKGLAVVGGYEFRENGILIGMVDLFNQSVWFFPETPTSYRLLLTAVSTSLLIRHE